MGNMVKIGKEDIASNSNNHAKSNDIPRKVRKEIEGIMDENDDVEHSIPPETRQENNENHDDDTGEINERDMGISRSPPPAWHSAKRDYNIIGGIILLLLLTVGVTLYFIDILKNLMIIGFFVVLFLFLGIVAGYFFIMAKKLSDFQALFLFHRRDSWDFLNSLQDVLKEHFNDLAVVDSQTGHSFGLLTHVKAFEISHREFIELKELHLSIGLVFGLYLLVRSPKDSSVWKILNGLAQRR